MKAPTRILIVDDEAAIRRLLCTSLAAQGYETIEAKTGQSAIEQSRAGKPDLVILDLGLPDMDGTEVLQEIRRDSQVPVVILSVRDDEKGKVAAFDLGADDYVTKPFGMDELLARVRTGLRHQPQKNLEPPLYRSGDLTVDLSRRQVTLKDKNIALSAKEFELLAFLALNAGKVVTHRQLLNKIWGPDNAEDVQYLRVYIRSLRQKLEEEPARPRYLLTETAVGYRLRAPD